VKRLSGRVWTGIVFFVAGLAFGACVTYIAIQIYHPISMPVSLAIGEVRTHEFRMYADDSYNIYIELNKRFSLEVLDCMVGISTGPLDPTNCKKGQEPILQATWTLWSDGRIVAHGYSDDWKNEGGWGNDTVDRFIGRFNGKRGSKYVLVVNFTSDGTKLSVTNPRLNVDRSEYPTNKEIIRVTCLAVLFVLMEIIGITLVISAGIRNWRSRY